MSHIEKETELLSNCRLVAVGADKMMYNEDEVMVEKWSVDHLVICCVLILVFCFPVFRLKSPILLLKDFGSSFICTHALSF